MLVRCSPWLDCYCKTDIQNLYLNCNKNLSSEKQKSMLFLVYGVKNVWVVQLNRHAVMKHWSVDIVVASLLILQKNKTCVRLKPRGRSLLLCHTRLSSALVSMITAGRLYVHSSVSAVQTLSAYFWWEFIARTLLRTDSHFLNKNSLPASHYLQCSITNATGMLGVLTWCGCVNADVA